MNKTDIQTAHNLLSQKQKIVVIPHRNPDGDAMGSTLGLSIFLKASGHEVQVISPNEFPDFLAWMPESEKVVIFEKTTQKAKEILAEASLVFTLDFNALHRTGELMEQALKELTVPFLMIDHHEKPDDYASYIFSDINYGSTCEMVYHFISELGKEYLINQQIASCLYTGIVTDSGSFKYPNTTSTTHRVVASLLEKGAKNAEDRKSTRLNSSHVKISYAA